MPSNPPIYRDPFKPGHDVRRGRPVGNRAKLAKRFFEDTYAAWEEQGPAVLARAAFMDPMGFASMVSRLMPQKLEVTTPTDGMSDERLEQMLELAQRMSALKAQGVVIGSAEVSPGDGGIEPLRLIHEKSLDMKDMRRPAGGAESALRAGGESSLPATPTRPRPETTAPAFEIVDPKIGPGFPGDRPSPSDSHNATDEDDVDPESLF